MIPLRSSDQGLRLGTKLGAFIALAYFAFVAGNLGRLGWNLAFVDGRVFPAWYGLDWGIAISGCFDLLLFFAMGMLVASLVGGSRRVLWALTFGLLGAAIPLVFGRYYFPEDAEWYIYLHEYSRYIFAPLGALTGGAAQEFLASLNISKAVWSPKNDSPGLVEPEQAWSTSLTINDRINRRVAVAGSVVLVVLVVVVLVAAFNGFAHWYAWFAFLASLGIGVTMASGRMPSERNSDARSNSIEKPREGR